MAASVSLGACLRPRLSTW